MLRFCIRATVPALVFELYPSPPTHAVADAHRIPLPDASVEAVWAQAVLEHGAVPRGHIMRSALAARAIPRWRARPR